VLGFLDHIERHIRLIDVTSFDIGIKEDESTESQIILSASLKANMYFLKPVTKAKTVIKSQVNTEDGN